MNSFLLALTLAVSDVLCTYGVRTRREAAPGLHIRGIRDSGGAYCQKQGYCCTDREDTCTVPYLDTICYCDSFCDRTVSDCCPDYWTHCQGIEPPGHIHRGCVRQGRKYPSGATYQDNCNLCTCSGAGRWDCEQHACLIQQDMIHAVNHGNYGWKAGNYSQFWGMTLDEGIRYRLGTSKPSTTVMNMNELHVNMASNEILPTSFDAAAKWPGMIHEPLDQGNCAGSWAFSTAAVASDRISIQSMGHMTPVLSPQHLLSCDTRNQRGCSGGRVDGAWWYLRRKGVVTDECYPFTSQEKDKVPVQSPCMMHSRSTGRGKRQATARCPSPHARSNEIYQATPAYRLAPSEKEIMKELMENGPVQAIMEVHEDFFLYKGGIYRHTPVATGKPEHYRRHGTHSVKITGWGEEKNPNGQSEKYWIAANSWGKSWGESGYFRIARGTNECGIEAFVVGVWGRVSMEDVHK
ncbi:tubulointerstitial nephritis antigen-like [Microcaecilia unicolor]|uniref:Tubulointerstitial nephritis antigen-like n=1 Tax=Microcaecilia unicolor TaxID=1415580 RepID=A0A6P7Z781_9AMPH|nr:tubulointerstitial nephritis antigen-like [Microcaecilia unicolor]XP_030073328.1 tubulointerstitial nephritis antigen-like [Microcaecilia unicolor]